MRAHVMVCVSLLSLGLLLLPPLSLDAKIYYVDKNHPLASDDNPGTENEPFLSVQMGINSAGLRDTVFIKKGIYQLDGFTKELSQPISIIGEDKYETVLDSMGTLHIIGTTYDHMVNMSQLKFTNYERTIFNFKVNEGSVLDGVDISDCIFGKVERNKKTRLLLARYDVSPAAGVRNISITNCDFLGLKAPGVKYIYLYQGIIKNINISNNNFYNLISNSDTRGATAIQIGENANLLTTHNVLISGNYFDTIVASTEGEIETHAILVYGDSIRIISNAIKEMNPGTDHEGIYMKGRYSLIEDNVLINATSHHGAIAIKGSGKSFFDTIRGNRMQSTQSGRGIYTAGPESVVIEDNYVKNTSDSSTNGLYIYAANNSACYINNNYSQGKGAAAYLHDVGGGELTNNTLISYESLPYKLAGSSNNIMINANLTYEGWPVDSPNAMANTDVLEGYAPLTVSFDGSASQDPNGIIDSYEWNFHDGNTSNAISPTHIYHEKRTYVATLIVTDQDGFKDMTHITIKVIGDELPVHITPSPEIGEDHLLRAYPNPFDQSINLSVNLVSETRVRVHIVDLTGRLVSKLKDENLPLGEHKIRWDGRGDSENEVTPGIYLVKARLGNSIQILRIIKY